MLLLVLLVVITTTTTGALLHRSKPKRRRPPSQDVHNCRRMGSRYGLHPLCLLDFGVEVEALNIESVDNGVCSDLDLNLVMVVVGYASVVGDNWGVVC
jgi:hypothetical protein